MPKLIDEYVGGVNTKERTISIAHMRSPAGWEEPGQTPEFEEYTLVLKGCLRVRHKQGTLDVAAGQADGDVDLHVDGGGLDADDGR